MAARLILPPNRNLLRYPGGQLRLNRNHPLYSSLRLCAVAMPSGGGHLFDYVSNTISLAAASPNEQNTALTRLGPAVQCTTASTGSGGYGTAYWPAIQETMQYVTMGVVMRAELANYGNMTIVTFGANMNLTFYYNGLFEWRFLSSAPTISPATMTAIDGHHYFYAITYDTATRFSVRILCLDLDTGLYSMSYGTTSGSLAIASGAYNSLVTVGTGNVNGSRVALGFIAAKYLGTQGLLDFGQNFWDILVPKSRDRLLTRSTNYKGPPAGTVPVNTTPPQITPLTSPSTEPAALLCSQGNWTNSPTTFHYLWKSSGTTVGTDSNTYTTTLTDVGATMTCIVTAVNGGGSNQATTSNSILVQGPPSVITNPTISGSAVATSGGTLITCNNTTANWRGSPTFTYQWKNGATPISGATSSTYTAFNPGDIGRVLTCDVTATNSFGAVTVNAGPSITMVGGPTILTNPSVLESSPQPIGTLLHVVNGSWSGSPTFTWQWVRNGSTNISGATAQTYLTGSIDASTSIGCLVTGTNANGSLVAPLTNQVAMVGIPQFSVAPSVSGNQQQGSTLACNAGTWSGSPTFTYQWTRNGVNISAPLGTAGPNYTTTGADLNFNIGCTVTASNLAGPATPAASSNTIFVIPLSGSPPILQSSPGISGNSAVPSTLTCNPGSWLNSPSFAYQWVRNGAPISGVGSLPVYVTTTADVGFSIGCIVTATNASGSVTAPITNQIVATVRTNIPTPADMGVSQTATLELVEVLDSSGTWVPLGSIDPGTHTFVGVGSTGNRIINGDMLIDQRNAGAAGTGASAYTVDRWAFSGTQTSKFQWQRMPITVAPGVPPFPNCLQLTSLSSYAAAASDLFAILQPIEAAMVSDFQWGTSSAQAVTLSFWALSTGLSGTFGGAICNGSATGTRSRSYPFTFSIPAPNSWVKIVITIPGDAAGAWPISGQGIGACLFFDLGSGSNNLGPAGAWASGPYVGATNSASLASINGSALQITGVKLESGSVATPYERQPLAQEVLSCQRYYLRKSSVMLKSYAPAGTQIGFTADFPVTMRAAPAISLLDLTTINAGPTSFANVTTDNVELYATVTATGVAQINCNVIADAELN